MANSEFITVLQDAIAAAGGCVMGVAADADGETRCFGAGQLDHDLIDQMTRQLIFLAARIMSKKPGDAPEVRQYSPRPPEAYASLKTFDLTVAGAILCISPYSLRKMADAGIVPAAKIGKRWVFLEEDLAAYLRDEIKKQTAKRRGIKPEEMAPAMTPSYPSSANHYPSGRRKRMPPPVLRKMP